MINQILRLNIMNKQVILTIFLSVLLLSGCAEEQSEPQEELIKTVNVETEAIEHQPFERYLKLVGTVEAQNDVRISAEVSGRIEEYFVEQGAEIKKGDPILKINDSQLQHERERLEAITAQARENYERLKRLYEQDSVGSEIEYLNARYNYEQNQASLESVKENIAKTRVEAPFDATVENILLEEGEMASPGTVLVRLIGTNKLKVSAGVPSTYSDVVNTGDLAQVWFDFQEADTLRLPITFVGKSISPQDRTFEVEISLPSDAADYKVDMIANVRVRTMQDDDAIVVNEEFVYESEGENVVYTVGENEDGYQVAKRRAVTLGPSYKNNVVIAEGVEAGDQLITIGSSFLQDDMRITIVESRDRLAQENL